MKSSSASTVTTCPASAFPSHHPRKTQINLKAAVFTMLYQHFPAVCKQDLFDDDMMKSTTA